MGLEVGGGGTEEEEQVEEKIPHMCESIGHRPLWGRCPKGPLIRSLVCSTMLLFAALAPLTPSLALLTPLTHLFTHGNV